MQVQGVINNNYSTSFGEKLIFDTKLINRATREEKSELAMIKRMFKDNGVKGKITVRNDRRITVQEIIENLKSKFNETEAQKNL